MRFISPLYGWYLKRFSFFFLLFLFSFWLTKTKRKFREIRPALQISQALRWLYRLKLFLIITIEVVLPLIYFCLHTWWQIVRTSWLRDIFIRYYLFAFLMFSLIKIHKIWLHDLCSSFVSAHHGSIKTLIPVLFSHNPGLFSSFEK